MVVSGTILVDRGHWAPALRRRSFTQLSLCRHARGHAVSAALAATPTIVTPAMLQRGKGRKVRRRGMLDQFVEGWLRFAGGWTLERGQEDLAFVRNPPLAGLPRDKLLAEDVQPGRALRKPLCARGPLRPAGVEHGQILLHDVHAGTPIGLAGEDLENGHLETHAATRTQ